MPKEVLFDKTFEAQLVDSPIPTPGPGQLVVKVVYAAANPKGTSLLPLHFTVLTTPSDWKVPVWELIKGPFNHGDDVSGYVHSVHPSVLSFKPGDRVAAFHRMLTPHGGYAEYTVADVQSTFHVPENVSLEEAVTVTLPAYTAAVGLSQVLELPAPWERRANGLGETPLIVYGGATAVGAFVIKLAKLAGIGPIIAVAGNGSDYVKTLLGPEDKIVDYRGEDVGKKLKEALGGKEAHHAYDAVTEHDSHLHIEEAITTPARYTHVLPIPDWEPKGIVAGQTKVGTVHDDEQTRDFAAAYSVFFERALADGRLKGHPTEVVGGLEKVIEGLMLLKEGKVSAKRILFKVAEE